MQDVSSEVTDPPQGAGNAEAKLNELLNGKWKKVFSVYYTNLLSMIDDLDGIDVDSIYEEYLHQLDLVRVSENVEVFACCKTFLKSVKKLVTPLELGGMRGTRFDWVAELNLVLTEIVDLVKEKGSEAFQVPKSAVGRLVPALAKFEERHAVINKKLPYRLETVQEVYEYLEEWLNFAKDVYESKLFRA